jgi:hypothetical protein
MGDIIWETSVRLQWIDQMKSSARVAKRPRVHQTRHIEHQLVTRVHVEGGRILYSPAHERVENQHI